MKKIITLLSFGLFVVLASCNNTGEAEKPGTSAEVKKEGDTSKTKVEVNSEGVSVETKGGTQVSVGSDGGDVKTKDLDLKVKPGGN